MLTNKRMKGEDFEKYKARRKELKRLDKIWLKGRLVFKSVTIHQTEVNGEMETKYVPHQYRNPLKQSICCLR